MAVAVAGGFHAASVSARHLVDGLAGRVVCASRDEELTPGVGEAVEWQEGEWHETRSLEKSQLLLIEGAFE
jgi:hypothetical protein